MPIKFTQFKYIKRHINTLHLPYFPKSILSRSMCKDMLHNWINRIFANAITWTLKSYGMASDPKNNQYTMVDNR